MDDQRAMPKRPGCGSSSGPETPAVMRDMSDGMETISNLRQCERLRLVNTSKDVYDRNNGTECTVTGKNGAPSTTKAHVRTRNSKKEVTIVGPEITLGLERTHLTNIVESGNKFSEENWTSEYRKVTDKMRGDAVEQLFEYTPRRRY